MVGVIRTRVIFESMNGSQADRADGAPAQVAEIGKKVGRDAVDLLVKRFGLQASRSERLPLAIRNRLDLARQTVPERFVLGGRDEALRLTALNVEEHPSIVPTLAPRPGVGPVDRELRERRRPLGA